ncbi:N-alpha-acetyltransferase 60 [Dermatophagoides farinae]|uniref:N-alpha-acetyltransferase 60 n=2 Tax=Dermatophagoides farinae TaxID=6954 RepID=A0A922HRA8_DERFA|nr:N-alpha-acetyltransferase 60-like [Dermatophagoides farinae]KAH9505905.1 N-alpha-acetyltransferase 60 [Dermatophagoides farinae]
MIINMSENFMTMAPSSDDTIRMRYLNPTDLNTIRMLCQEWFPVRYPDAWYETIVNNHNQRFCSLVATINDEIVALLVTEIRCYQNLNYEDFGFLAKHFEHQQDNNIQVAYILTLGVIKRLRRRGIATLLVKNLIQNLQSITTMKNNCKAIYLHVLTTNMYAIRFYEKLQFQRYKLLPLYYSINDCAYDGYSYVYYLNGGHPSSWWWLPLFTIHPKYHLLIIRNSLRSFTIQTYYQCDNLFLKSFSSLLSFITRWPLKFLRKLFDTIIYRRTFNIKQTDNHLHHYHHYVC